MKRTGNKDEWETGTGDESVVDDGSGNVRTIRA
jgi:hypothetical protein